MKLHSVTLRTSAFVASLLLAASSLTAFPSESHAPATPIAKSEDVAEALRHQPPWQGREAAIEEILINGTVTSKQRVGSGITNPWKVTLEHHGVELKAIFKPLATTYVKSSQESYEAEIAAYRLSRELGLNMVPPTVERKIGRRLGSLQLWVDGYRLHAQVATVLPDNPIDWSQEIAKMRAFDDLIDNPDRHNANFLVNDSWDVVLIDHSRALAFDTQGRQRDEKPPQRFDRDMIEKLRALDYPTLDRILGDLYTGSELKVLLHRREELLQHVARLEVERGSIVYYD